MINNTGYDARIPSSAAPTAAPMGSHEDVLLIHHQNGCYVEKHLKKYNKQIYAYLQANPCPLFPAIYAIEENEKELIVREEYLQGETLEDIIKKYRTLPSAECRRIALYICDALIYLHNAIPPIIHRDLKPSNIILSYDGRVHLIDFDASRFYDTTCVTDSDTIIMGTRQYAAPEQYGFIQSDARTDIFSLGVTIYHMLTGCLPVQTEDYLNVPPLNQLFSWQNILRNCLAFDPANRYPDVETLKHDIYLITAEKTTKKEAPFAELPFVNTIKKIKHDFAASKKPLRFPFMPPGFRTLSPVNMVVAVLGYASIFWLSLTLDVTTDNNVPVTGFVLYEERLFVLLTALFTVFLWFNYLGLRHKLPFMRHPVLRFIGCIIYPFLVFTFLIIIVAITSGIPGMQ